LEYKWKRKISLPLIRIKTLVHIYEKLKNPVTNARKILFYSPNSIPPSLTQLLNELQQPEGRGVQEELPSDPDPTPDSVPDNFITDDKIGTR
jgi:hypothetical protein